MQGTCAFIGVRGSYTCTSDPKHTKAMVSTRSGVFLGGRSNPSADRSFFGMFESNSRPSVLNLVRMGHPILRAKAKHVMMEDLQTPEFRKLLDDMAETMFKHDGVGLAAPQVGHSVRLAVLRENPEDIHCRTVIEIINPLVKVLKPVERKTFPESCLSIPGLVGEVPRPQSVLLEYLNRKGEQCNMRLDGFPAIVVQHEVDHLDGILFLDRMPDMKKISYVEEYEQFHAGD